MPYIVPKEIKGHTYYYLHESYREGDKVRSRYLAYLGKEIPANYEHLTPGLRTKEPVLPNKTKKVTAAADLSANFVIKKHKWLIWGPKKEKGTWNDNGVLGTLTPKLIQEILDAAPSAGIPPKEREQLLIEFDTWCTRIAALKKVYGPDAYDKGIKKTVMKWFAELRQLRYIIFPKMDEKLAQQKKTKTSKI